MERADIVEVLQRALKQESLPQPDGSPWDESIAISRAIIKEAIAQIERLRSLCGCADVGASFRDVTKDLPRAEPNG